MSYLPYLIIVGLIIALVAVLWLWRRANRRLDQDRSLSEQFQQQTEQIVLQQKWTQLLERNLQSMNIGVVLVDSSFAVLYVNRTAEKIFGLAASQLLHQPYQQALPLINEQEVSLAKLPSPLLQVFEQRSPLERQHFKVKRTDQTVELDISWMPVLSEDQHVIGGAVMLFDNTKQKALEEMKVDFVSIVSHELRTPITAIKGYIQILLKEVTLDPEHAEMLRRVSVSNDRQLETVESLLNLSRLERGTVPLRPREFHMEELIGQVVGELDEQARSKGIGIRFDYPRFALPKVWADPDRTREIILNLCTNAVKYTDQGLVKITLEQDGRFLRTLVTDTGPGITPEVQAKLFEKFQRGEGVLTESKQGMGLGLYITKQFVELMGGKIGVRSEVGQGSTFAFILPLK
jgi:PAS domain S-box-containing protein